MYKATLTPCTLHMPRALCKAEVKAKTKVFLPPGFCVKDF